MGIFGTIGRLAGAYFGPIGSVVGGMIGDAIDGPVDLGTQEGPRLTDLSVQTASYGAPLPIVKGTARIAGNAIWLKNNELTETSTSTTYESGGSIFGGGSETTVVTWNYHATFAVSLTANEIAGIRRIWANGKLIYDVSTEATINPDETEAEFLARVIASDDNIPLTVYSGSETQTADSVMSGVLGAANTPAYRGTSYVVFDNLPLKDYQNGIPNFEFEVVEAGAVGAEVTLIDSNTYVTDGTAGAGFTPFITDDGFVIWINSGGTGAQLFVAKRYGIETRIITAQEPVYGGDYIGFTVKKAGTTLTGYGVLGFDLVIVDTSGGSTGPIVCFSHENGVLTNLGWLSPVLSSRVGPFAGSDAGNYIFAYYQMSNTKSNYVYSWEYTNHGGGIVGLTVVDSHGTSTDAPYQHTAPNPVYPQYVFVVDHIFLFNKGYMYMEEIDQTDGTITRPWSETGSPAGSCYYLSSAKWSPDGLALITTSTFGANNSVVIWEFDPTDGSLTSSGSITIGADATGSDWIDDETVFVSRIIDAGGDPTQSRVYSVNRTTWATALLASNTVETSAATYFDGYVYSHQSDSDDRNLIMQRVLTNVTTSSVYVSEALTDICATVGLAAADIDVTDYTSSVVLGYTIPKIMTARKAIEPLLVAYPGDAAEIDDKLVFVKRGGSSVVTISDSDLATREYGTDDFDPFPIVKMQDVELPVSVTIKYPNRDADYEIGSQATTRQITSSVNKIALETTVVLESDTAKQLTDIIMNHAWVSRYSHSIKAGPEYAYLTPTDIITINEADGSSHTCMIKSLNRTASGIVEMELIDNDAASYTSTATAVDGDWVYQTITTIPSAITTLLNIPMLSDSDDIVGFYVSTYGSSAGFSAMGLYVSDDDSAYNSLTAVGEEATIGATTTTLADGPTTIIDKGNTVTVQISTDSATLATITEAAMLAGGNEALIGANGRWEVIRFQTVVDNGSGSYTLSNLLRGSRGTEHNTANHTSSDTFILVEFGKQVSVAMDSSYLDDSRYYKPVPLGRSTADVSSTSFTMTGEMKKPFSPVHVRGSRDSSDNITITWTRRSRFNNEWDDDYDTTPLNELSEVYEVDILNGAAVVRTISTTSETASYTAAQQTTDFGSTQSSLDIETYQISATVGRGTKGAATI